VKGPSILIVEDENIVALDMRMRLEAMGYSVADVVDTGAQASARALALSPSLILMDIKLKGGLDGIDAARAIRETADIPVIFVTAFTDERTLDRVKLASPYGYVVKPFHERELRIAIELALYKHRYELSMRRAKEIAEESNRLKGEFLANMSHELKTPLNSVIGFTQLALDLATDEEQREFLAMAAGSAKSLLTLIESILDFARMDAGKLVASPSPFSLDDILEECADALAVGAYPKGLEVGLEREPGIRDSLIGDSQLLRRVLFNLIDNAVKFTDKGRVSLAVRTIPDGEGDSDSLAFSISDSGIGMPPEKLGAVFERFIQLDPSTTRKAGGTGLGLAIVRKAVELMDGTIEVASSPGRGTRFDVVLPFAAHDEPVGRPLPRLLEGKTVAIAGFDESGAKDAALAARELGAREIFAGDIIAGDFVAPPPDAIVLVDERAVSREAEAFVAMKGRLVVATRYGSPARSRLESAGEIAFTPLPFRVRRLADSLASLSILSEEAARKGAEARGGGIPRAGAEGGKAVVDDLERIYAELAAGLESAMDEEDFEKAERLSMEARRRFRSAASDEGEKLAFSAMLLARKGDAAALRQAAKRSLGSVPARASPPRAEAEVEEGGGR